jgi:glutamate dehydrogenase/leucine dehydrogenase
MHEITQISSGKYDLKAIKDMKNNSANGILQTSIFNLKETADRLKLAAPMIERLIEPKEKVEFTLNVSLSDDKIIHVRAFIIRHNDAIGPSKGGIRMTNSVTPDDISGLAMEMTWKTALIGVPFGGGKSGICFETHELSDDNKERIMRSFTRGAKRHIGPEIYIPAPDMGTNEEDMGHIRDCISYSDGTSITRGCFVTGKPIILGGIVGRKQATGKGVVYSILAACKELEIDIENTKVAVQGFGNVGSVAALSIAQAGAKVIAISDAHAAIINKAGLDITNIIEHHNSIGTLKGYNGGQQITNEQLLTCDCDILIPAATQSQITPENADKIKAKIIAEGANAPTTPQADQILNEKGIFVIPDILCNAGGVFVSYLEYTQETQREQMTLEQVEKRLQDRMQEKFNKVYQYTKNKNISMRQAAMDIAVGQVVEATRARGILP